MPSPTQRPDHLVVSYAGIFGGAERLLLDWVPALAGRAVVLCPAGRLAEEARDAGLEWRALPERALEVQPTLRDRAAAAIRLAGLARDVRRAVAELRPRRVVAWSMPALVATDSALHTLRRPPPMVFQHNDLLPAAPLARLVRRAAPRCARIMALSHAIAANLDPAASLGDRLRVVHPGVDLRRFSAAPAVGAPVVLLLGAIVGWKRPDLALEAVARAAGTVPDVRLLVAGEPLDRPGDRLLEALKRRAAAPDLAGRVEFLGRVDDPRPVLAAARCLLHCSDAEPFGLVLAEALASGRPVVAPAAGGPREIVDPSSGCLYPPGDAAAAAAALTEVLVAPPEPLASAARARAEACFDLSSSRRCWATAVDWA